MTNEIEIPIGEFTQTCPQCGAELLIESDGIEPKGHDRVICPTHGDVGTRETFTSRRSPQEHGDQIYKAMSDHVSTTVRDMLKRAGFNPE